MKKAAVFGPRQGGVVDAPDPEAGENWVVVKIHTAPMCTEFKTYVAGKNTPYLGHEAAGEVVEVAQPCRVEVGDRVVVMPQTPCGQCQICLKGEYIHCQDLATPPTQSGADEGRATMAQFMLKQDWMLVPIPDDLSFDHASMACCGLGPTFGAVQRAALGPDDTLLITGLGPVGLGGVINGTHRGSRVIGVDTNKYRAAKALELGAGRRHRPDRPGRPAKGVGVDKGRARRGSQHRLLWRCRCPSLLHRRDPPQRHSQFRRRERSGRHAHPGEHGHVAQGAESARFLALQLGRYTPYSARDRRQRRQTRQAHYTSFLPGARG